MGLRTPVYPCVALRGPTYRENYTLITLGTRHRTKPLILKARKCLQRFDSHRPLHSLLAARIRFQRAENQ
jgi:hypothetical protein